MGKLDLRQLIVGIIITVFLTITINQFSFLTNIELLRNVSNLGTDETFTKLSSKQSFPRDIFYYLLWIKLSTYLGLFLGFLLFGLLLIKKKISLINFVLIILLSFILLKILKTFNGYNLLSFLNFSHFSNFYFFLITFMCFGIFTFLIFYRLKRVYS